MTNQKMASQTIIYGSDQVPEIALLLAEKLKKCAIMTFTGPLGAGKTTLIKALLKECGVVDQVTSPTFTYVNRYENQRGQTFYHFDLYRISTPNDFIAAGFNEYLYALKSWAIIEWPQVIEPLLGQRVCHVQIDYDSSPDKRILMIRER